MIPSIETIVEDLAAGKITKSQAVTWLYAHAEGAANELRDQFAAAALPAIIAATGNFEGRDKIADNVSLAFYHADAMLEARKVK